MTQELVIECDSINSPYKVYIEVKDIDVLAKVKDHPAVQGKEGEELVKALLEAALPPEGILSVTRKNANGKKNDGPNGEPAYVKYNPAKAVVRMNFNKGEMKPENYLAILREHHLQNDKANDPSDGVPAVQWYSETTGKLILKEYCKDNFIYDPPNGEPGRQQFDDDGTPINREYLRNGEFSDPPNGEPAQWRVNLETKDIRIWHYPDSGRGASNLPDGTPAYQRFTSDGNLVIAEFLEDGKNNDGPDGLPSILHFDKTDRSLTGAWRYKDDKKEKALRDHARHKLEKTPAIVALKNLHPPERKKHVAPVGNRLRLRR